MGLANAAFAAAHLPQTALPRLQALITEATPGWHQMVVSSVAQLYRGYSGKSAEAQNLRRSLIESVFAMPPDSEKAMGLKATLAGIWPSLDHAQRLAVARAATHLLRAPLDNRTFDGLSRLHSRSHDISIRATSQAFGAVVHTLPDAEKSDFLGALRDLGDSHFAETVDVLGRDFQEHFPEIFIEARQRISAGLKSGNLGYTKIPLRMRPYETAGIPSTIREAATFNRSARPDMSFDDLLKFNPPDLRLNDEMVQYLSDPAIGDSCVEEIAENPENLLGSDVSHVGVFRPEHQIAVVDALASHDALHRVKEHFFFGIRHDAARSVLRHVASTMRTRSDSDLPPILHLPDDVLSEALSPAQLERWKAADQIRHLNENQRAIASKLDQALPALHLRADGGLDAYLASARRDWLQQLATRANSAELA